MKVSEWIESVLDSAGRADDDALDLGRTALALAALDHPESEIEPYLDHLSGLGDRLAEMHVSLDSESALAEVIAHGAGYTGDRDHYDDPANADLIRVIDRRRGLPVALGIIYLDVAARAGIPLSGLAFPGHFLVRIDDDGTRRIIDPFNDGAIIDIAGLRALLKSILGERAELTPEHWRASSRREVVIRLVNNLRTRALRAGNNKRALDLVGRMTRIAPLRAELWRDQGVIAGEMGLITLATAAFETCLGLQPGAELETEIKALLKTLKRSLN